MTKNHVLKWALLCKASALVLFAPAGPAISSEQKVQTNADQRILVFYKVSGEKVAKLVPDGWEISSPPKGPFKSFNLVLVFIDSFASADGNDKPIMPFRGVVGAVPAKETAGKARGVLVVNGLAPKALMPGAYKVYTQGSLQFTKTVTAGADGKVRVQQSWKGGSEEGGALDFSIKYQQLKPVQSKLNSTVRSGADPKFKRFYRGKQTTEIVFSTALGKDQLSSFELTTTGAPFGELLDGTEELLGVLSVPSYVRSIYLPK